MGALDKALQTILTKQLPSDPRFYLNLLQICTESRASKRGRLIHKHLICNGFDSNLTLNTKMIIFYAKICDMDSARKVFDKMPERNIVSWTALLSGYSQNGLFKDALLIFWNMHHSGVKENQYTYGSALRACTKLMCLRSGMQIQGCVQKNRFAGNLFVQSALVDLHSKCGSIYDASYVFQTMSERDLVCWNAMIGGFSVQGFGKEAFRLFQTMLIEGVIPDCFTFGSLLTACAQGFHLPRVRQIHDLIIHQGFGSDKLLCRLLIDAYTKCGCTKFAYNVFKSVKVKDAVLYTAMIAGYARHRDFYIDALHLFVEVYKSGMTLDDFLLCTALNICASSSSLNFGRQIHALALKCVPMSDVILGNAIIDMYAKCGELEEANYVFDQMEEKNVISWSSLIDGCAKHGFAHKAMLLYRKMENEGLKPNDITFLSLLFACSHAGMTREGLECFISMVGNYNLSPTEKHYSCLVDIFARGGQLGEAFNLMYKMKIQPNSSLIGSIFGASNVYGDVSLIKVSAKQLLDQDFENPGNYVALASIYAAAGLWEESWATHRLMENRNIRKSRGFSIVLSPGKKKGVL